MIKKKERKRRIFKVIKIKKGKKKESNDVYLEGSARVRGSEKLKS